MTAFPPLFRCRVREHCSSLSLSSPGGLHPSSLGGSGRPSCPKTPSAVVACSHQCVSFQQLLRDAVASLPPAGVFRNFHFPADAQHFSSRNRSQGLSSFFLFPLSVSRPSPVRSARQAQAGGVNNAFYNSAFSFARLPALHALRSLRRTASRQVTFSPWWPCQTVRFFLTPQSGRSGRPSRPVRVPPSLF